MKKCWQGQKARSQTAQNHSSTSHSCQKRKELREQQEGSAQGGHVGELELLLSFYFALSAVITLLPLCSQLY